MRTENFSGACFISLAVCLQLVTLVPPTADTRSFCVSNVHNITVAPACFELSQMLSCSHLRTNFTDTSSRPELWTPLRFRFSELVIRKSHSGRHLIETTRSSAQGNCSAKSLAASVMSSIFPCPPCLPPVMLSTRWGGGGSSCGGGGFGCKGVWVGEGGWGRGGG